MEDHPVELESGETPRRDAEGRFIATEEITNVFVMEKQPGWGEAYPDDKRNGDWDYAWFDAEGTLKHSDPARYEGCFSSHQSRAGDSEEHTSELQSLMSISYAVFSLKKKKQ